MSFTVKVVEQGVIVNSGLESKVEGQMMIVMNFSQPCNALMTFNKNVHKAISGDDEQERIIKVKHLATMSLAMSVIGLVIGQIFPV